MKYSGFDFERMGTVTEQPAKVEPPLPAGYPYPKLAAAPDMIDGYPVCRWFEWPARLRHFNIDRRGCSIPAVGLPEALRPCSLNGWIIRRHYSGKLELERGPHGTANEGLCKMYLINNKDAILEALLEVGEA